MIELRWDLLPKADRAKIRAEMIEQMVLILAHDGPQTTDEERRKCACRLVNESINRERANQAKEKLHVN